MGATQRSLRARPKILKKKYRNIKSTNQNENFSQKKVCLVPKMCTGAIRMGATFKKPYPEKEKCLG
jgi:hypothetical protein